MSIAVIIVAGGSGSRMKGSGVGRNIPKQYRSVGECSILRQSVEVFSTRPDIGSIQVVIRPEDDDLYHEAVQGLSLLPVVTGGATRQQSVYNGLQALKPHQPDWVLIHDAARPFLSSALLGRVINALEEDEAVIPALPLIDTVKHIDSDGTVLNTIKRSEYVSIQTPQGFHYQILMCAYEQVDYDALTDDASIVETAGGKVRTVEGERMNFKVTTDSDLQRMKDSNKAEAYRIATGTGLDVHAFEIVDNPDDNHMMLCGVAVPYHMKLKGHSDADVGLHALADALLGAISQGDIGQHFPPSDDRWKDADSCMFITHIMQLVEQEQATIEHVDITFIGEAPRIGAYREAMGLKVAELLMLDTNQVNIKATTTETLGFLGRKEGLAAQAVATVKRTIKQKEAQ